MSDSLGFHDPLYVPPDGKAKVDIVFVHGLGGHRIQTWTSKPTDDDPEPITWPRDLLPHACPTARIFSFGYDSHFAHFYPFLGPKEISQGTTIDTFSSALYQQLSNLRHKTGTPEDRPIIYVAHSLGGLVVANALSRPPGTDAAAAQLSANTVGVIFMGTPFEGSSTAKWGSLGLKFWSLASATEKATVKDLEERSVRLAVINDALGKYIKTRDRDHVHRPLEVVCCFEDRPTRLGAKKEKIVERKSAAPFQGVKVLSIAANHSNMVKFVDEYDDGYGMVSGLLAQWIDDLDKKGDIVKSGTTNIDMGTVRYENVGANFGTMAGNLYSDKEQGNVLTGATLNFGRDTPHSVLADILGAQGGKPGGQ